MSRAFERVCVVGLGYIGLPTAAAFSTQGVQVVGVDISTRTVEMVNAGESPIVEPDLASVVSGVVARGSLTARFEPVEADAFVLAVPTPFRENRVPDLSYVEAATRGIASLLKPGDLVVLESTSPPGATLQVSKWLAELRPDLQMPHAAGDSADVNIAYCPERVLPGRIMIELVTNDRVVGGVTPRCAERAAELYRIFSQGEMHLSDSTTAELVKLSENAFRDINIAYANELGTICERLGVDPWDVIELANRHPRVNILKPGPGVGGHCIAVDPWFIVHAAPELSRLIRTAREVNDAKPHYVVGEVVAMAERFKDPVIACLGLAFKANIDDLRESPAVDIVRELASRKAGRLLAVEPHIDDLPAALQESGAKLVDLDMALAEADIVVGLVDHDEFRRLRPLSLRGKVVYDTRGMWR
jgi:UDP-N-acetyl-D-mannosaminuronic acid dehydrogenase